MHIEGNHTQQGQKGKKPFKCGICDYRCSLKSCMKSHVSSVHEENTKRKSELSGNLGVF